jgi:hypothetical protein
VSTRPPDCLIQDPKLVIQNLALGWIRELSSCSSCSCLFSVASRFKCVLGTARISQSETVYLLLRRSSCGGCSRTANVESTLQLSYPQLSSKVRNLTQRVPSCGNQSKVIGERFYPFFLLPTVQKFAQKNKIGYN